jgi:hypothetical protein
MPQRREGRRIVNEANENEAGQYWTHEQVLAEVGRMHMVEASRVAQVDDLHERAESLRGQLDEARRQLGISEEVAERTKTHLHRRISSLEDARNRYRSRLVGVRAECGALREQRDRAEALAGARGTRLDELERAVADEAARSAGLEHQLQRAQRSRDEVLAELSRAESRKDADRRYAEAMAEELNRHVPGAAGDLRGAYHRELAELPRKEMFVASWQDMVQANKLLSERADENERLLAETGEKLDRLQRHVREMVASANSRPAGMGPGPWHVGALITEHNEHLPEGMHIQLDDGDALVLQGPARRAPDAADAWEGPRPVQVFDGAPPLQAAPGSLTSVLVSAVRTGPGEPDEAYTCVTPGHERPDEGNGLVRVTGTPAARLVAAAEHNEEGVVAIDRADLDRLRQDGITEPATQHLLKLTPGTQERLQAFAGSLREIGERFATPGRQPQALSQVLDSREEGERDR